MRNVVFLVLALGNAFLGCAMLMAAFVIASEGGSAGWAITLISGGYFHVATVIGITRLAWPS